MGHCRQRPIASWHSSKPLRQAAGFGQEGFAEDLTMLSNQLSNESSSQLALFNVQLAR